MKIIFLDFDGVTRTLRSMKTERTPTGADHEAVAALNEIMRRTGARIVVSSSWRGTHLDPSQELLAEWGVKGEVISMTPRLVRREGALFIAAPRGQEIQCWLDVNQTTRGPIESFVILDDEDDMGSLKHRLVQSGFDIGLTLEHAERAIALLQGEAT